MDYKGILKRVVSDALRLNYPEDADFKECCAIDSNDIINELQIYPELIDYVNNNYPNLTNGFSCPNAFSKDMERLFME